MKASIIIPVYNVEEYLGKCVESALKQTFTNTEAEFEVILVDDGSTDGSPQLCDEYAQKDDRVRVIHQENKGLGGARNTGIKASRAEWLLFLDSDDYIEPNSLDITLNAAEKHGADMIVFGMKSVDDNGETLSVLLDEVEQNKALVPSQEKQLLTCIPAACNKLYKRELFDKADALFPERVWYEDIRTTLKLLLFCEKVVYIEDVLYNYLSRDGSITKNINADRNVEIIDAFDDIFAYFKENDRFNEFKNELEFLTILHVFISASVRVIRIDRKHPLVETFRSFTYDNFPNFAENEYISRLSKNQKIIMKLLQKKMYRTVETIFRVK